MRPTLVNAITTTWMVVSITQSFIFVNGKDDLKEGPRFGEVFQLNDLNFDRLVNGSHTWLIDIYAPWCPACRDLEPVWRQLAVEVAKDEILVGKVDGTKETSLLLRFALQHYPSIFHIQGKTTREHTGGRSLQQLVAFARGGYAQDKGRSGCGSPVSQCGRALGEITKFPARARAAYLYLRNTRKISDVTLVGAILAGTVGLGLLCIAALDFYYSRQPLSQHSHQE